MGKIRWGIMGTGFIAGHFARGLAALPQAELVAVGSRSAQTARAFARQFGVPRTHPSYQALAADPEVDVVYIATPHTLHHPNTLLCLDAGKAVLCEKPFAINATQAAESIERARQRGLFLMEAMWSRFLPALGEVRRLLAVGSIGQVRLLSADFGFRAPFKPEGRLFNPALGGGALLDVGVYTLSLASMIFGPPRTISSQAHLGQTGVDEQAAIILGYEQGQLALLSAATRTGSPQEAVIMGTEGWLRLHAPWWMGTRLSLHRPGREVETRELPYEGNGYNYEAAEVMRCLDAGILESATMPLDETLAIMHTLDQIRGQWGLVYPMEKDS